MIKRLLFLLFLSPVFSEAQTSVYHPFPDSDAVWREDYFYNACDECPGPNPCFIGCSDSYHYYIQEDTTIASYTYHKLYRLGWHYDYYGGHSLGGIAFIRQDTSLRKVFCFAQGRDTLLYDFSMNVGDTLKGILAFSTIQTVGSIDSILIGTNYRKRFHIINGNCVNDYALIEGIGCDKGLFDVCISFEAGGMLVCFMQNGQTLYPDTTYDCPSLLLNSPSVEDVSEALTISPNPAHDVFNVECKMQNAELKIYDVMGREVMKEQLRFQLSTFNFQLPAGVYFVRVGNHSQKLIIE